MSARRWIVLAGVLLVLAILGLLFRGPIVRWFSGAPMGGPGGEAVTSTAGGLRIATSLDPDPPRQEGNTARVLVRDSEGQPVRGAEVSAVAVMPAMGAMAEMRAKASVEDRGDGRYSAKFDLPMSGSWTLEVHVSSAAGTGTARYGFTVGTRGLRSLDAAASPDAEEAPLAPLQFPDAVLASLRGAFDAYEQARSLLAQDTTEGLAAHARAIAASLRAAAGGLAGAPEDVTRFFEQGASEADALAAASDLKDARRGFGAVSRRLIMLASCDPRLREGWHVFRCSMVDGFEKWIQRTPRLGNPYMGQSMLECGSSTDWTVAPPPRTDLDAGRPGDDDVAHHTCSMHPSVKQHDEGACPLCGMSLTPVTKGELRTGVITIDSVRRQKFGVRTEIAETRPMRREVRAPGRVTWDERQLHDVTLRVDGWIEGLRVETTGQMVRKGDVLFRLYSPELFSAQQELLVARGLGDLVQAARQRLVLWGLDDAQIDEVLRTRKAVTTIDVHAPASGVIVEKDVVEGARVAAGARLYRIASLDPIWVEAQVYEPDLPLMAEGQAVTVTLPGLDGYEVTGKIAYVYPELQQRSRTGRVRVELPNPDRLLRPDMYASVRIVQDLGQRLQIPDSAVIYAGPRRLVFVDLGEGRLRPQEVTVGHRSEGRIEVRGGLKEGDRVVASGNFLVAAESRIRTATGFWGGGDAQPHQH